jgi:endonuclease YncB( thermonuclease family)
MTKVIPLKAKSSNGKRQALPFGYKKFRRYGSSKPQWRRNAIACVVGIAALIVVGAFFPKVTGPRSVITTNAAGVRVIDGDTVSFRGNTYRLVGFDTPETSRAKCDSERARGVQAAIRLQTLISSGDISLEEVRCSCMPGTAGTRYCNFGRLCGILHRNGENVGDILIREGLARPFRCGEVRCPKRLGWCDLQRT